MARSTVESLLDELEEMVDKGSRLPLSRGRATLYAEDVREIIGEIRYALPQECREARAIMADRDQILREARTEAEGIVRAAREKARILASQTEVVKLARQQSSELASQTQQKCREMRRASSDYIDDLMKRTDEALSRSLSELRKTRQSLRASQHTGKK